MPNIGALLLNAGFNWHLWKGDELTVMPERPNPNQPMKHSMAHVGELKATFRTGLDNDE